MKRTVYPATKGNLWCTSLLMNKKSPLNDREYAMKIIGVCNVFLQIA